MIGLVIVCAVNLFARVRSLAFVCVAICALLAAAVVLAALLGGAGQANPHRLAAILRALLFFVFIGAASLMQAMSSRSLANSG